MLFKLSQLSLQMWLSPDSRDRDPQQQVPCQISKSNITSCFKIKPCGGLVYHFHTNPRFTIGQLHAKLTSERDREREEIGGMCVDGNSTTKQTSPKKKNRMQLQPSLATWKVKKKTKTQKQRCFIWFRQSGCLAWEERGAQRKQLGAEDGSLWRAEPGRGKSEARGCQVHRKPLSVFLFTLSFSFIYTILWWKAGRQTDMLIGAGLLGSAPVAWRVTHILSVGLQSLAQAYGISDSVKSLSRSG